MLGFIIEHHKLLLAIYGIGAVVVFIATAIFLVRAIKEDKEECMYADCDYYEPSRREKALAVIVILIVSALLGILWVGFPVITVGVIALDKIQEKYPHIMGGLNDNEDGKEE